MSAPHRSPRRSWLVLAASWLVLGSAAPAAPTEVCDHPGRAPVSVQGHGTAEHLAGDLEKHAADLYERAASRTGAADCAPITVELTADVQDAKELSPSWHLPAWAAGAAHPEDRHIVVGVTASRQRQDRERILLHELAHLAVASAAGAHRVPRWFDEGTARVIANEDDDADRLSLSLARVRGRTVMLEVLDRGFPIEGPEASLAYAVSGRAVRLIEQRAGPRAIAQILDDVRLGMPFGDALSRATGRAVWQLDVDVERSISLWAAWATLLREIDVALILASGLAILAGIRARHRNLARMRALDDDEPRAAPLDVVLARFSFGPSAAERVRAHGQQAHPHRIAWAV